MAFTISDECTACGTCAGECPSEAIKEVEEKFVIDQDTCIECGVCVETCPVEAIKEV